MKLLIRLTTAARRGYDSGNAELSSRRRRDHGESYCTDEGQSHDSAHTRYQEERQQVRKEE